ncbi:glutathione peroxidase [Catenovulum adriaticum]|uniref:Glutathione peroxidase n=1 Tax=Catenovulum adriaticum TaxID=2984846 RepID=A0ABY7APV7_9ALTE|nr:glutathione peroxidase [Catenovulum sp. TS8]WAJ71312.1 glutathione peroxidase [Catenovulum sp. TS8]
MSQIYQFSVTQSNGETLSLNDYQGKWLLIVNTASECGFTSQYEGLEALYQQYQPNLEVLAFPCNQFGQQEPGDNQSIQNFCEQKFKISFPLMAKIDVNGDNADPLFKFLKSEKTGILGSKAIKWNFTKFLVNPTGDVVKRYAPTDKPHEIEKDLAVFTHS